ncbi:hypothetical protein K493DRAFT_336298 [Basidiobolus meristosporus CBS 931.73]|uniref:Uncharacterized protein n=1 Tax=Basidiobolus meristosporus CBS 931.73 TaxID=1314790 RepID=A0A1Y1YJ40_9FUNG|nr:hypothetical protein K493DRAFT_336298 [Basidiobolus meristosporus CBS 931.73]|eukprot:ORX98047.1 hypothetical protein K493DRAFT_336298 [Basidiobolus meristosporus CBS 931.73]
MPGDPSSHSPRLVSSSINSNKSYRNSMQKSFAGSRAQQNRARLETSKISGPKPLNLPSLRREHATAPTVLSGSSWRTTHSDYNRQDPSPRTAPSNDPKHSTPVTNIRAWSSIVQVPSNTITDDDSSQTAAFKPGDSHEKGDGLAKSDDEDKGEERNWDEMSDESIDFSVDVLEFADGTVKIDKMGEDKVPSDPWKRPVSSNLPLDNSTPPPPPPPLPPSNTSEAKSRPKPSSPAVLEPLSPFATDAAPATDPHESINKSPNDPGSNHPKETLDHNHSALPNGTTRNDWAEKAMACAEDGSKNPSKELSWRRRAPVDKCPVSPEKFENQYPHRSIHPGEHHGGLDWRSSYANGKSRIAGQNARGRDDFDRSECDSKRDDRWAHQSEENDQDLDKRENCEPKDRMKYFQGENRRTPRFNPTFEKKGPSISDIDKIMSSIKRELSAKGTSIEEMKSRGPNASSEPNEKERRNSQEVGEDRELSERQELLDGGEPALSPDRKDSSYSSPLVAQKPPSSLHSNSTHISKVSSAEQVATGCVSNSRSSPPEPSQDKSRSWDTDKLAPKPFHENGPNTNTNSVPEAASLHSQDKPKRTTSADLSPGQAYSSSNRPRNESSFFSGKHGVDETLSSTDEPVDPSLLHRKDAAKNWIGKERKLQFYSNRSDSSIEIDHSAPFTFGKKYLFSSSQDEEVLGGKSKASKPSPIGEKRGVLAFGIDLAEGRSPIAFLEKGEDKQPSKAGKKHSTFNQSCNVFPKEFESIAGKLGSVGFMVASEIIDDAEKRPTGDKEGPGSPNGQQATKPSGKSEARSTGGPSESRIASWSRPSKNDHRKASAGGPLQDTPKAAWTNEKPISLENSNHSDAVNTGSDDPNNTKSSKASPPLKGRDLGYTAFSKAPPGKSNFMYTPLPQEMGSPTLWVKPHPGLRMAQGEPGSMGMSQVPMLPPLMDPSQAMPPRSPQQPVNTQYVQFVPLAMPPHQFMPPYANMPLAPYPQMNMTMDEMNQAGWVMQPAPMGQYHSMPNNPNYQYSKRGHHHHHERSPQQSFQRTPPYQNQNQNQHRPPAQNFPYSQQPPYSSKLSDPINASPRLPNTNIPPQFQRQAGLMTSNAPPNYSMYKGEMDGIPRNPNQSHPRHLNQRGRGAHAWSGMNQRPGNANYPTGFVSSHRGNSRNMY